MTDNNPYEEYDNRMVSEETNSAMLSYRNDFAQTAEHPIIKTPIMNDINNKNDSVPTTDNITDELKNLIVTLALGRGSRIVSTLEKIEDMRISLGLVHKSNHALYNLSRNTAKRIFETATDKAIEAVYNTFSECAQSIIDAVSNIKQTAKPRTRGGVVSDACVQYAVSTVRGDILRSNRVANALEGCALRLCASRDMTSGNIVMSEALDKALSKVYASIRSQAKKNDVEIGGKSNTATKTAAKTAILEELLRLKTEDSYQFDIIIGEVRPLSGQ